MQHYKEDGKYVVFIPVAYSVYGRVEESFDSLEEMKASLKDREFIRDLPLPENPEYLEDSYEVDTEQLYEELASLDWLEGDTDEPKNS